MIVVGWLKRFVQEDVDMVCGRRKDYEHGILLTTYIHKLYIKLTLILAV